MAFPKPPFKINKDVGKADAALVKYLKTNGNFSYLQAETRTLIGKLTAHDLRTQNSLLLEVWPKVLTDALRKLKQHDPREWDRKNNRVSYSSFFHEGSLGVTDLRNVLESFAKFESMLYGASPDRYRDHIAHAFRVWIIGQGVLREHGCLGGLLFSDELLDSKELPDGRDVPAGKICSDEWECMWALAALCHDLGYPLSHIDRINSLARDALRQMGLVHAGDLRFGFSQQMLPFHETIIRLMSSRPVRQGDQFGTHLQNKYYLKFLKSFDNLDHGIVSALLVSKSLVYFLESDLSQDERGLLSEDDAKQFLIRREILRAVGAHTCQDVYHLRFDTLSFLLYMIDELQCWGRPTLEELQHQAADMPEAEAEVVCFQPKKVAIIVRTGTRKWSVEQQKATRNQLSKLQSMLRLGVGTSVLKDHYLEFAVVPNKGRGVHLLLKKGKLAVKNVDASSLDCRRGRSSPGGSKPARGGQVRTGP
ncbi:MAG: hypothetical protein NTV86_04945 [Planctomycetota bacterium]|nr:hypothetical protein [Planctomycetota bacterium]